LILILLREPGFEAGANEFLGPASASQTNPGRTAFTVESQIDVEERATAMFAERPLCDPLQRRSVVGELELVPIGKLADLPDECAEQGSEFIEMPLPLRTQRSAVTGKRGRGSPEQRDGGNCEEEWFLHESTLRLEVEFKSNQFGIIAGTLSSGTGVNGSGGGRVVTLGVKVFSSNRSALMLVRVGVSAPPIHANLSVWNGLSEKACPRFPFNFC